MRGQQMTVWLCTTWSKSYDTFGLRDLMVSNHVVTKIESIGPFWPLFRMPLVCDRVIPTTWAGVAKRKEGNR